MKNMNFFMKSFYFGARCENIMWRDDGLHVWAKSLRYFLSMTSVRPVWWKWDSSEHSDHPWCFHPVDFILATSCASLLWCGLFFSFFLIVRQCSSTCLSIHWRQNWRETRKTGWSLDVGLSMAFWGHTHFSFLAFPLVFRFSWFFF